MTAVAADVINHNGRPVYVPLSTFACAYKYARINTERTDYMCTISGNLCMYTPSSMDIITHALSIRLCFSFSLLCYMCFFVLFV